VSSRDNSVTFPVNEAYAIPDLNVAQNEVNIQDLKHRWNHLTGLDLSPFDPKEVTVLLGMNVRGAHDVLDSKKPENREESPEAVLTPFGWIVVGPTGLARLVPEERKKLLYYTSET